MYKNIIINTNINDIIQMKIYNYIIIFIQDNLVSITINNCKIPPNFQSYLVYISNSTI